ncbi:MAG: carboxypeptidase regulatory-like domain-containing protein [Tepidisphaeraceae bacterium]|jgi:plastocyanin
MGLIAGCGRGEQAGTRTAAAGNGVIRGTVTLAGFAPLPKLIPGSPMVTDESIVIGPQQGLKNVIVYLMDAPRATFVLQTPAVLDQIKCVYVPHVVAVQTGQTLRLKSSDAMLHNVHLKCAVNPDANYGFPGPGQRDIRLALPEAPFTVKCDVHPWMSAWVGVFDHPWFAVSADDGSFTIQRVPPGTYTLVAWQESLPQQQQQITVSDGGQTDVQFVFPAP